MGKSLSIIMFLLIITFLGFGIIIPVLPELVSPAHLAIMLAVYSAASFLVSPIWGTVSDRIGRRPVLMIGTLGFCASFLLFGLSVDNLIGMYASRVLGGIFSGAVTACAVAYVADVTNDEERTKGMGLVGMSIGIGFIFGPAFGGMLSTLGKAVPFFVAAGLALCAYVLVATRLKESVRPGEHNKSRASRWTAFNGSMKYLYVLNFLVSFTLSGLETILLYFQQERIGANAMQFGMMLFISGTVGALVQGGIVRRYVEKGQESRYIVAGLVLSALGFFLLLLSHNFWTASLYLSVFAVGNALLRPCITSLITQKTTVGYGVATGLSSSMDSLGRIAGPLLGAAVFYINTSLPFTLGGAICLAALLLLVRFNQLDQKAQLLSRAQSK